MNESTTTTPVATTTTVAPTNAPAITGDASAQPSAPVTSRAEARSLIHKAIAEPSAAPGGTPSTATSGATTAATTTPSPANAPADASTTAAAPDSEIEIHPESGPSPELGSLKLKFKGGDGRYVPVPAELAKQTFELTVGGKTYVKDLAGFGRLAADGIASTRHATENHQIRTQVIPQYEQHVSSLTSQLQDMIALNRELLSDENKYVARRQEFMQLNSPEQRADRAERALADRDRLDSTREQSQQHASYYKANVLPAVQSVFTESPTVTNEEILGKITLDTSHMVGADGKVAPEHYPKFVEYLRTTLAPWAKSIHAQRNQADTARREAEQRDTEAAQRRAQLETRNVGAMVPASTSASTMTSANAGELPPPKTRAEARARLSQAIRTGASA